MPTVAGPIGTQVLEQLVAWVPALNYLHPWVFFAVMVAAAVLLSQLIGWVFRAGLKVAAKKTRNSIDDIIVSNVHQPISWLVFTGLLYLAFAPLEFSESVALLIRNLLNTLNITAAAWLIHRVSKAFFTIWHETVAHRTESIVDDTFLPILSKFVIAVIWICALLATLAAWGLEIGPFLAGLGLAGIAIGFAVQDSLKNIFGGVSLAFDRAYKIGDKIQLGDGTVGVVHDMTLRSSQIRTYDGDLIMVPNGKIANENIYTYAQPHHQTRVQVDFGVVYGSDVDKVKKVVRKAIDKMEGVMEEPEPVVHFMDMADFALTMRAYFWVPDYNDGFAKKREATQLIYEALNNAKVSIPFPTRTVYLKE